VHVAANVLNALAKSAQPAARRALAEIRDAKDRAHAEAAINAFADEFGAKWPKAVAKVTDKPDALLAFFDFPAEHWIHLKSTNAISSRPSPQCACAPGSRKAPARGRQDWRWRSSCSSPPSNGGVP
jgi:putative transposase